MCEQISAVHEANYSVYGVRKMHDALRRAGISIGRDHLARLMRRLGLQGVRRGKPKRTTIADTAAARPQDLVRRQFHAARPNQLWVCDLTYIRTWVGFAAVACDIIRSVPPSGPLPSYDVLVGYRWGETIADWRAQQVDGTPEMPSWARGEVCRLAGQKVERHQLVAALRDDLHRAFLALAPSSDSMRNLVVSGHGQQPVRSLLHDALPDTATIRQWILDPTALGLARLATCA